MNLKLKFNQELLIDIFVDIFAGILIAIGVYNFAAAAKFPMVGTNGIALIFYHILGWPIGTTAMILNIPIALFCFPILGKHFFVRSIRTIIITSTIIDIIAPLFPVYAGERMLSAICCGVFSGLGYAMIYMRESSQGGADFIMLSIKAKHPHLSIGNISFILDSVTVFIGVIFVTRDIDSLIYGVLICFIVSTVVDRVMYGMYSGKVTLIITNRGQEICKHIDSVLGRGSTILKATGSYSKSEKDVVLCACNNKQMYGIRKLVKETDKNAFVVIMESNEVVGAGFSEEL